MLARSVRTRPILREMSRSVPSPRRPEVPLDTEQARSFYQRRIGLFARIVGLQSLGFAVLSSAMDLAFNPRYTLDLVLHSAGIHWHLAAAFSSLVASFVLSRATFGMRMLPWFDGIASITPMVLYAVMAYVQRTAGDRLAYVLLLIVNLYQLARAVIVPSNPRQTALIGIGMSIPVLATSWFLVPPAPGSPSVSAELMTASYGSLWCLAGLVTATFGSHVIYGLRQEVREARRLGQYTLVEKIGEGGMGVVYKAHHALLRRPTAIKLLPPEKAGAHNLSRFEREVQITSRLTHPNTVAIYDYGRTPDGIFYYAMEYLEGIDLQELGELDGPQEPARIVHILVQVCGALAEAHAVGLVHRDIKPANVILCERGGVPDTAKVVDFGLVKELDAGPATASVALSGVNTIMGTPLYLSPEAITDPDKVDGRSDLYALGAVAYFLLSGHAVYEAGNVVEICAHHLHTAPVMPSERLGRDLPADLQAVVLRCLEKDPAKRPQSASELRNALLACDIPHWTESAARTWWERHRAAVIALGRESSGSRQAVGHGEETIAVDLQTRVMGDTEVA